MKNEVKDEDELRELYYQKMAACFERLWGFSWEKNGHIPCSNSLLLIIIKNKVVHKNLHEA